MGIFDNIPDASAANIYTPKSEQEAIVGMMYAAMMADGKWDDEETSALLGATKSNRSFEGHDINTYLENIIKFSEMNSKNIIDCCIKKINSENGSTVFALIMEIFLADGIFKNEEKEIAEYIMSVLKVQQNIAEKIIEVIMIKNKII